MSQIDPNGYDEMPDDMGPEAFDMPEEAEAYDQRMWAGGARPPTGPRPPVGPRPPGWQPGFRPPHWGGPVGPGQWPFWGYWGYRMLSAWKDIRFLKKLVGDMLNEDILKLIEEGIIAPGPNSPVQGPGGPTTGITGPIIGVTDGSDAGPGEVGEFIFQQQSNPFTGASQTIPYLMGPIPAGDWDIQIWFEQPDVPTGVWNGSSYFVCQPYPTGVSDGLDCNYFVGANNFTIMSSPRVRASLSTPTILPILLTLNQTASPGNPGTMNGTLTARRMR